MTTGKVIMLRNPNDNEKENWQKFWLSFSAWFDNDALQNGIVKEQYRYFNSGWNGGVFEFDIDFEKEYNIEYGESFPVFSGINDYDDIRKYIEIAYARWINSEQRYQFTIKVNDMLKKFSLPYRMNHGKIAKVGQNGKDSLLNAKSVNDIKLQKGEKVYSAFDIYTIQGQKAQGGNGKVYEAVNTEGIVVALKVVFRETGKKLARFKNEIAFCEKYGNQNIIKIIDRGTIDENFIYYVMPMAKETLRDRIKRKIAPQDAEEIFLNILKGLEVAHKQDAFHRDIKPENILFMDDSNNAVIADFGIAHFCEDDMVTEVKTMATERLANFQYAAPEQRKKGFATRVDGRADVYAAGLILNEMFTGELVGGNNYRKIADIIPEYSYLDEIFERMYCQNPKDRIFPVEEIINEMNIKKQI